MNGIFFVGKMCRWLITGVERKFFYICRPDFVSQKYQKMSNLRNSVFYRHPRHLHIAKIEVLKALILKAFLFEF